MINDYNQIVIATEATLEKAVFKLNEEGYTVVKADMLPEKKIKLYAAKFFLSLGKNHASKGTSK